MINKHLIKEWDNLFKSDDLNIDVRLKEIIEEYVGNYEESINNMVNPMDIIEEKLILNNVKRQIKGKDNWIINLPTIFRRKLFSTPLTQMNDLKSQIWTFGHILISIRSYG